MNRRKPMTSRQMAREKLVFRYSSALERGDFEVISAVLREAENDPVLERMLHEMNDVYRAELAPPPALPSFSANHNHRNMREDATMSVTYPSIRRVPMPGASRGRWSSTATLAAAIIAIILFAAVLIARRPPNQPEQGSVLQNETVTPTSSPTWTITPSEQPTSTWTPTFIPGGVTATTVQDAGIIFATLPPDMPVMCQGIVNSSEAVDGVNIFSDSSTNSVYIGRIPLGMAVNILGSRDTSGAWYYVRSASTEGWMSGAFIVLTTQCLDASGQPIAYYPCGTNFAATLIPTQVQDSSINPFDATATYVVAGATGTAAAMIQPTTIPPCSTGAQATAFVPYPTPTAVFDLALRSGGYDLITTGQIGDIPANTRVRINSAQFDGTQWLYDVIAKDGQTRGLAYDYQLTYVPGVTPGAATPTAIFGSSIGTGFYSAVTTQPIGDIPAGTKVHIGSAWFNGDEWIYQIQDDNGHASDSARESQLSIAPGYEPGMPTPTAMFFGNGNLVTLVQVGDIPANTLVQTTSGYFNGAEWVYGIGTLDGSQYANATDSQLRYATASDYGPGSTPVPTETATPTQGP
ncbi:MAG: SH3 domain-containing protein [Chloroflexota bacterium]